MEEEINPVKDIQKALGYTGDTGCTKTEAEFLVKDIQLELEIKNQGSEPDTALNRLANKYKLTPEQFQAYLDHRQITNFVAKNVDGSEDVTISYDVAGPSGKIRRVDKSWKLAVPANYSNSTPGQTPQQMLNYYDKKLAEEKSQANESSDNRAARRRIAKLEAATLGIRRRSRGWWRMRQAERYIENPEFIQMLQPPEQGKRKQRSPIDDRLQMIDEEMEIVKK